MTQPTSRPNPAFEIDDDRIGWVTFDDPERPVNVLTEGVMRALAEAIDGARAATREARVRAIVFRSAKPGTFIAGADVDSIAAIEDPADAETKIRLGQAIYADVAALPVPTVAAIDGTCLGGGTELALACSHRVLTDSPKTGVGLPEVMLGILPAWGGTTRLPRLVGLRAALDMLLTGDRIDARKARRIGFADEVVPTDLLDELSKQLASRWANARSAPRKRPLSDRLLDSNPLGRSLVLRLARRQVMSKTGGNYPAPLRILDVLAAGLGRDVDASLALEARAAAELVVSPVCKNLIHVFHMRESARKRQTEGARRVHALGVLGAGVMGGGIAQLAAYNGVRVYMKDIRHEAVTHGLQHADSLFAGAVKRHKLTRRQAEQRMELISGGLDDHGVSGAELVVEAVVERLDVKREVLREAERHVRADCVLATNTSSLSVDAMAEALERPERFCGMHFFNPVHRMPLVEVVRGSRTSEQAVATTYALALALGKVPVIVNDGPGFLVNRILGPYLNEAGFLLGDGATIVQIDATAKTFGMPMGPLRLIDEVGIDVSHHAGAALYEALGDRLSPAPALVALGETDRLGRKGGRGFYAYEGGKERGVDESVYDDLRAALPGASEPPDERDVRGRLLVQMVNEAARVLGDRIVATAADVDLAMIMGTGFPPFRGGLLRFADAQHPRRVLERTREIESRWGARFAPAPLLEELARSGRTFYETFGG